MVGGGNQCKTDSSIHGPLSLLLLSFNIKFTSSCSQWNAPQSFAFIDSVFFLPVSCVCVCVYVCVYLCVGGGLYLREYTASAIQTASWLCGARYRGQGMKRSGSGRHIPQCPALTGPWRSPYMIHTWWMTQPAIRSMHWTPLGYRLGRGELNGIG